MHSDYKITFKEQNVMEEENYSKSPCRQGNGLKIRKITFEVGINKKSSYTSEILNTYMATRRKVPHQRCSFIETQLGRRE